ncbi:hypothetical protein Cfla_1174 [Cellulomonas flavigena DSM 20109]|uniref:Uncharacterized protein n=1 Tax=Cellulomonas flavigena (strain ATCC 482 / DSM 20109 / BCRC 11376 / JCM 18109 / NBRC 3775 / NCIMB 8073 / NRS 134) TaxID=446466 RepID=D5UBI3_CELFN|nr:hypothetical protein [Cellulomonas flavigena]ADG74078.1 hypothetical protein Cfla_1174 [Cellulomonas flavigena DSM 20109]
MTHRGTRLAYVLVLLYAAATAFLVVRGLEESGVLGADHLLHVSGEGGAGGAAAVAALTEVSREQRVDVGRLVDDVLASGELRHLYLAVGRPDGPRASWAQEGYPAFVPQGRTQVHALAELGHLDPRGGYVVFGDAGGRDAVADAVRALGYQVETRAYYDAGAIAQWVGHQPFGTGLLVVALLVVVVVAAGVLAGVKGYAVQRLHGPCSALRGSGCSPTARSAARRTVPCWSRRSWSSSTPRAGSSRPPTTWRGPARERCSSATRRPPWRPPGRPDWWTS